MALLVAEEVFGEAQDGAPRAGCGRLQLLPYWMGPTLSVLRVLTSSPAEGRPPWSPAAELVEAFIFLVAGLLSWGLGAGRLGHSCRVTGFIPILSFHGLLSYEGG